ncbi:MAG TPA: acetolactate synthase small subunit [Armatimonadota bacterium]|jgi:acetolactate synthase-1/3 small subunit
MKHTISVLVENKPGVLARCAALFARRGFNLDSLAVAETEDAAVSRIILTVTGDDRVLEQICRQLDKLVDVLKVLDHTQDITIERELCLMKVQVDRKSRAEVMQVATIFRGEIVDVARGMVTVEMTGDTSKIDAFVELMGDFGIVELVRTGKVVLARGLQAS